MKQTERNIRVLELPECRMASSGYVREAEPFAPGGTLARFRSWWREADKARTDRWFARDFLMYARDQEALVWLYALPDGATAADCPFPVEDFDGGLYAAAVALRNDQDEQGGQALDRVRAWVRENPAFELDERPGHYDLRHVIAPGRAGQARLEIYVPIRRKQA